MATHHQRARSYVQRLQSLRGTNLPDVVLPPEGDLSPRVSTNRRIDAESVDRRWALLGASPECRALLLDETTRSSMSVYASNIENFIGTVRLPVGIAGPLRVNGLFAKDDFYIPMATTEAALVASYTRGAQGISEAGGCTSVVVNEGVSRSPVFAFDTVIDAGRFILWVTEQLDTLRTTAESTTRHGKLVDLRVSLEGNRVYLVLEYLTGDAAGQNMVTIATDAVCQQIIQHSPVRPTFWSVEGNMSGDKKASAHALQIVRGKKVVAEVLIPGAIVERRLRTTARRAAECYQALAMGGVLSGSIGIQGHYANGLAALFIACGQDAACVIESATGVTRLESRDDGSLYAAVTMPNLIVGTVGGGTALPTQKACLDLLGLAGPGNANALAEVCAALALAGELSIIAALSCGEFTRAHHKLARRKPA